MVNLRGRSLLKETDLTAGEFRYLVDGRNNTANSPLVTGAMLGVFESPASLVFGQAENRTHAIKALMAATLSGQR